MIELEGGRREPIQIVSALNLESGRGIIQGGLIRWRRWKVHGGLREVGCCEEESCGCMCIGVGRTCPKQQATHLGTPVSLPFPWKPPWKIVLWPPPSNP